MTNNAPDYDDNLAFQPQGDWSDTQPKNNTDRTQSSCDMVDKIEKLTKQLEIAVAGLQYYANEDIYIEEHKVIDGNNEWTSEVMLDNGVKASYFLKKIKELEK